MIERSAVFSPCRRWRYQLRIQWGYKHQGFVGKLINFIMLNPSTADENVNDPTVERCQRRAMMLGYDGLIVTNLFALRSTDPQLLYQVHNPIGQDNDAHIMDAAAMSDRIVVGWGIHGNRCRGRADEVLKLLSSCGPVYALRITDDGSPEHPLYIPYDLKPVPIGEAPRKAKRKSKS